MHLETLGWNEHFAALAHEIDNPDWRPARVVSANRSVLRVEDATGPLSAVVGGRLESAGEAGPPATGDWVLVEQRNDAAVVRAILPRRSQLSRRRPGAAERAQIVAANIDFVLIVDGLDRGPNPRRIERGVALAFGGNATPLVVLSKSDLCDNREQAILTAERAAPFVDVAFVSCATREGLPELAARLKPGSSAVLVGPSGVGKSSLVNALLGEDRIAVGDVRSGDHKGRHTTTRSELLQLAHGACVIDTPGIRELGLWMDAESVDAAFADIDELAAYCRFRDCRHENEPGCAVRAAVESGEIDATRLSSYHKLRREAEVHAIRHDAAMTHIQRKRDRQFAKLCRTAQKIKKK